MNQIPFFLAPEVSTLASAIDVWFMQQELQERILRQEKICSEVLSSADFVFLHADSVVTIEEIRNAGFTGTIIFLTPYMSVSEGIVNANDIMSVSSSQIQEVLERLFLTRTSA